MLVLQDVFSIMDDYLAHKWCIMMFGLCAYLFNVCFGSVERVGTFTGGDCDRFARCDVAIYDTQHIVSNIDSGEV